MQYPPEFIEKVKRAFPTWKEMHEKLEAGAPIVGRYLSDNSPDQDAFVLAQLILNPEKLDEAKIEAEKIILKRTLWHDWRKLDMQQK